MIYCLQPAVRSSITVFNLQSEDELSEVIFRTVARCKHRSIEILWIISFHLLACTTVKAKMKKHDNYESDEGSIDSKGTGTIYLDQLLELTMDWDCIDVAKEFALEDSLKNIQVDTVVRFFL